MLRRVVLLGLLAAAAALFWLDRKVVQGFGEARWRHPVRMYAAPRRIDVGVDLDAGGISDELHELGYRAVTGKPTEPGTFRRSGQRLDIYLNAAPVADAFRDRPPRRATLELESGRVVRSIELQPDGTGVESLELEPRPLEGLYTSHWTGRMPLELADVPTYVVDAVLAAEDERFLSHHGIDLPSLARAVQVNWVAGKVKQGGSTITQQIVKNYFLTQERTFTRKLREIPMALLLDARFDKREILECYLATVYLGHDRLVGIYGLAEASQVYFGKPVGKLTLAEGATLAGMIRAPNIYSPLRHPDAALRRRDQVIEKLHELGWITKAQAAEALAERPKTPPGRTAPPEAYFMEHVRRTLHDERLDPSHLGFGSAIFTTLDPRLQRAASAAVDAVGRRLDRNRSGKRSMQIAVVAIDPRDGAVRALVGGRDFLASQLDRTTRSRRQVGSVFKPFVYLAAIADPDAGVTPASILDDEPLTVQLDGATWKPQNVDEKFRGPVTVRHALEHSLNVPTVRLAQQLGITHVADFGDRLGLAGDPLPRVPAIALGAFESSLLRVTAAYTTFPRGGERIEPHAVAAVKAPSGVILTRGRSSTMPVAAADATYVVHAMLEGVVARGTAAEVGRSGLKTATAGKTGTSDESRDAWFVGYTPSLVVGVWVGYDDDRSLPGSAAQLAVPVWINVMRHATAGQARERFTVPPGVELVSVEAASGKLADARCGPAITEAFLDGTAPTEGCAPGGRVVARTGRPSPVKQIGKAIGDWFSRLPETIGGLLGRDRR
ncbi:PBP1A family penicillin-binding protein [Candidatus Binatia bacterium]|nr:PBP1A family penicillin-binding protein [Candidatus Binatia bacterium]